MKKCLPVLFLFLLPLLLVLSVAGEETETPTDRLPEEYTDLLDALPDDFEIALPDGIATDDPATLEGAVREMSSFSYLLQATLSTLGLSLGPALSLLAAVAGILLLSSVARALAGTLAEGATGSAFSFVASLAILVALLTKGYSVLEGIGDYFRTLGAVTAAALPLEGVLYSMGGNLSAAVASSGSLSLYMTIMEETVGATVLPFCGICLSLSVMSSISPTLRLSTLSATLKKNYTTLLAFLMMLLLAMLASQTVLGNASDTLAMKSAKFAAGNLIPVVGGSVSELLRSVSAGVGYLRGNIGISAILLLLLLLLPTLIRLLLYRLVWQLAASLAELLGCDGEKKLLEEFTSLCGFLITAAAICSSVVLLSFVLLIRSGTAIG